jgi:peptidoglycan LD-endopeptidase CwlK
VRVRVPQVEKLLGDAGARGILFYKGGAQQLQEAFSEVERLGLMNQVKEWCGSFSQRTQRGSNVLSTHTLGISFDINCSTMHLGQPLDLATHRSFAELVQVFEKHGFLWGGSFGQADPMHFQLFRLGSPY